MFQINDGSYLWVAELEMIFITLLKFFFISQTFSHRNSFTIGAKLYMLRELLTWNASLSIFIVHWRALKWADTWDKV